MDFMILLNPLLAPIKMIFDTLTIVVKVLMVIPAPLGVLITFSIAVFVIRIIVGLL